MSRGRVQRPEAGESVGFARAKAVTGLADRAVLPLRAVPQPMVRVEVTVKAEEAAGLPWILPLSWRDRTCPEF